MENTIKIAFFDVDGTLASSRDPLKKIYDRVPDSAKRTIQLLKEKGITPVIATGRGKVFIRDFANEMKIDSYICANGLCMIHEGNIVYEQFLAQDTVTELLPRLLELEDITLFVETSTGNYIYKDDFMKKVQDEKELSSLNDPIPENVYQLLVMGENIKERACLNDESIKARIVAPNVINIFSAEVSKASGIERMLSLLDLHKGNAIAFGDEENDIEMFGAVGCSVAMGNGVAELKAIADHITTDVDEDGIYNACKHFKLVID